MYSTRHGEAESSCKKDTGPCGEEIAMSGTWVSFLSFPSPQSNLFRHRTGLERHPNPCICLHGLYFLSLPACPMSPFTAQETKLAKIAAWQPGTYTHGSLSLVTKFLPAPQRVLATPLESVESTHTSYLSSSTVFREDPTTSPYFISAFKQFYLFKSNTFLVFSSYVILSMSHF